MFLKSIFTMTLLMAFASFGHTKRYYDTVNPHYGHVEICRTNPDGSLMVATHCGRFAHLELRNRNELIEVLEELEGLKKYDEVSVVVKRRSGLQVVPMTISFLYEGGYVDAYEAYTAGRGPHPGSRHVILPLKQLNREKKEVRGLRIGDVVCVQKGFTFKYGFNNEHKFEFKAGERYRIQKLFENGYANLKVENNPLLSFWNYGSNNKLHVYFLGDHFSGCQ